MPPIGPVTRYDPIYWSETPAGRPVLIVCRLKNMKTKKYFVTLYIPGGVGSPAYSSVDVEGIYAFGIYGDNFIEETLKRLSR